MTSWHQVERSALADALLAAGPEAPTLCTGWRARHLAAHLVLRESAPLVAAGIAVPALAGRTARATERLGDRARDPDVFERLVQRIERRPPWWHPFSWAGDAANLLEFFVHTEDVRRGDLAAEIPARRLDPERTAAIWGQLVRRAPLLYRAAGLGVVLVVPDGPRRLVRRPAPGATSVVVRGPVGELVLHAHGRTSAARVDVTGSPDQVARLERAVNRG